MNNTNNFIKKRINKLIKIINQANKDYYLYDNPILSDIEYDKYMKELLFLELKYPNFKQKKSPTQKIGGYILNSFKTYQHRYPLLSLNNAFSKKELIDFDFRCKKELNLEFLQYIAELKIDGLSVSLIYKKGILKVAATRGDGYKGENVTTNIFNIKDIPKKLKNNIDLEVRGEIYMDNSTFLKLNKYRANNGLPEFKNQRNAAAGSIRQLNIEETKKRNLKTFFYEITYLNENIIKTQEESLKFLINNDFSVNKNYIKGNINDIIKFCDFFDKKRKYLPYTIDGIVLKIDNLNYQYELGFTSKSPKGLIAYKFLPEQKITKIKKIIFSVGRTGVITPIAEMDPIFISGSTVKRASLHNEDYIKIKDIQIGDYVIIQKAGEIIPEIVKVIKNKRKKTFKINFPKICPVCKSNIIRVDGESNYKCIAGLYCSAQLTKSILHFASRDAMDIEGLGEKNIELLIKNKLINNLIDIYLLKKEEIIKLDRFDIKSSENLIQSIKNSKNKGLASLLYGLGILLIGNKNSKIISKHFRNIDLIINAKKKDFIEIDDIGEKASNNLFLFFKEKKNLYIINQLKKLGVSMENTNLLKGEKLKDKNIVLTGSFEFYDRKTIAKLIDDYGGNVLLNVTKKTDFIIVGKNPGSKLEKAKKMNISIMKEDEFLKLINDKMIRSNNI